MYMSRIPRRFSESEELLIDTKEPFLANIEMPFAKIKQLCILCGLTDRMVCGIPKQEPCKTEWIEFIRNARSSVRYDIDPESTCICTLHFKKQNLCRDGCHAFLKEMPSDIPSSFLLNTFEKSIQPRKENNSGDSTMLLRDFLQRSELITPNVQPTEGKAPIGGSSSKFTNRRHSIGPIRSNKTPDLETKRHRLLCLSIMRARSRAIKNKLDSLQCETRLEETIRRLRKISVNK